MDASEKDPFQRSFDSSSVAESVQTVLWYAVAFTCLLLARCQTAEAVVVESGDGAGNVSAPIDDPGFANIGTRNIGTAIYLGNRWVMTANHLKAGPVVFGKETYTPIAEETVRVPNPDDLSAFTDILLMRLPTELQLPSLRLPCGPRRLGSEVILIGNGQDRATDPTYWSVDINPGRGDDVWTTVDQLATSDRQGFLTTNSQSIRWGRGSIGLTGEVTETLNDGDVQSFTTSFAASLDLDDLSQAVRGDSGGATFEKNAGVWELVGLIFAVDLFENQPNGTRSAVYGNSTFIADLYRYADELRELADFEPQTGDFDGNGQITADEIDWLLSMQNMGPAGSCHFDVNGDHTVSPADVTALLDLAGTLLGDTDLSGDVGFADFLSVSGSFGTNRTGWANGDFDGDGLVQFSDFLALSAGFGKTFGDTAVGDTGIASVPEPGMSMVAIVLLLSVLRICNGDKPDRWSVPGNL